MTPRACIAAVLLLLTALFLYVWHVASVPAATPRLVLPMPDHEAIVIGDDKEPYLIRVPTVQPCDPVVDWPACGAVLWRDGEATRP